MVRLRTHHFGLAFVMAFQALSQCAFAGWIEYYSWPDTPTGSNTYIGWTYTGAAARFTVPSGSPHRLDAISLRLIGDQDDTSVDIVVWGDDSGQLGPDLYRISDAPWGDGYNEYDLSSAGLILPPEESFFVGYVSDAVEYADSGLRYTSANDHDRSIYRRLGSSTWNDLGGELLYRADLVAVPEPTAGLLLAIGSFLLARRRRKKDSATS